MAEVNIGTVLRLWRRGSGLKQQALADLLGVTQATVSRWENGLDHPSPALGANIRNLMSHRGEPGLSTVREVLRLQTGIRVLVDLDGMRLVASTGGFKKLWPELAAIEGQKTADHLVGQSAELYSDLALMASIRRGEVVMVGGVSDRQVKGFGDNAFRHYWTSAYRKIGPQHFAEISFEACDPDAELGVHHLVKIDEIE